MQKTSPTSKDQVTQLRPLGHEAQLHARLAPLREALAQHPLYGQVQDLPSLRIFMTSHVFAVWDFMALLKTLQRSLTCVEVPWLPSRDAHAARLINAIVLAEETDEVAPGEYTSHFDLYLTAMDELGADRDPIDLALSEVRGGRTMDEALSGVEIPESTRDFVRTTMRVAGGGTHEVAASFLHGREDLVPEMFRRILAGLGREPTLEHVAFRRYLERHVDLDENEHSPMARQLLRSLCGDDEVKWAEATEAAAVSLTARLALWDGVLAQVQVAPVLRDTLRPPKSGTRRRVSAAHATTAVAQRRAVGR
jgi:Protein of unknown function (DUF3050)